MLLLADGARLFEAARDAAIEFIFTMDRQVIAISWIARRTSAISRAVAVWPIHPQISQIAQIISPGGAFRNLRSAVLRPLTSDLCSLSYSHSIVLGGLLEMS
jgi:hypothetical protein